MKAYISKYRYHWVSPYTVLEKVLFWKDWENIDYDTPWVKTWSDRIMPLCVGLQKVLDTIHPKIDYVKIDKWDTWSMDHTLAMMALPMLRQLQETKHGAPFVDDDDVPEGLNLRSTEAPPKENEWDIDGNHFKRWDWVIGEMIFAFECKLNDNWDDQFWSGEWGEMTWEKTGETMYNPLTNKTEELSEMKEIGGNRKCDWDGRKKVQDRITNGFRLFGKYYEALWD